MLKLFYITNNPQIAMIAQNCGVDRIFVDMEYIGKEERQPNMNTVKNHHTVEDVKNVRQVLDKAELLVRINPIHNGSKQEIDDVIAAGADVIMLPMWKSVDEVRSFFDIVDGRVKTILLLETDEAMNCLDDVVRLKGIDEVHIGLNDLHLSQEKKFLFELLVDGTVDKIAEILNKNNIPFGIGGFGRVYQGDMLPAENIIAEHYRLGSSMAILSRAFCNTANIDNLGEIEKIFKDGITKNRAFENELKNKSNEYFETMHLQTKNIIKEIVREK